MRAILLFSLSSLLSSCVPISSYKLLETASANTGRKAIQLYTRVLATDSNTVMAYWRRGNEYHKLHRYISAIADFDRGIALDSYFNEGYLLCDRGLAKEALSNFSGAEQDYTAALRFCHPEYASTPRENIYFYRGRTRLKLGDTLSASQDTDSALHYWPHFPRARYQKGRLEVIKGHYQQALTQYLNLGYGNPLAPADAQDEEFTEDVFYYGLLKYKLGEPGYCEYWQAATKYGYAKAAAYEALHCQQK
jgi:tetratricopeptide (TPR) repeat protein